MDIFIITTVVFIFFVIFSYFLKVIKQSAPLFLIYLVFCFSYIIDQDISDEFPLESEQHRYKSYDSLIIKPLINEENINNVSKPVVSFNPKPIVIDSNLIIQKNVDNLSYINDSATKDDILKVEEKNDEITNTLKLKEIMICRGIYKRNPIKPGFKFTNNVDSLFCYTKISNSGSKQEIKHIWYHEENLITSVVYNIKTSYNYRSWSKKTIMSNQIGKWRVDVVNSENIVLGSREFQIYSLNDLY